MNNSPPSLASNSTILPTRFVAFDISKSSVVVAALDARQQVLLQPKKVSVEKLEAWVKQNLKSTDAVVLEATGSAWYYYDLLRPLVASVTVANPQQVKLISQTRVKTDARDALALARLLAVGLIPQVWVPPQPVRELRSLVAQRQRLIKQRTQSRNRLHAIVISHNLIPPSGDPFSPKNQFWWNELTVSATEKLLIEQEFSLLSHLQPLVLAAETELHQLSTDPQWKSQCTFLIQLPGIGVLTAMVLLSAIGDITRFESAKQLVGYSGLGASIYSSGKLTRTGSITKQGRRELRTAMVEAAWSAVEQEGHWQEQFKRLSVRLGRGKAIVAIARKLLVVVWHVLTKAVADHHANEEQVARKLLNWAYGVKRRGRRGLGGREFLVAGLERLKLGQELTTIKWGGRPYTIRATTSPPCSELRVKAGG